MQALKRDSHAEANSLRDLRHPRLATSLAFSLIELLITLALMLILASMMWGFGAPNRQRAEKKACQENLSKIYLAMQIYANDFNGKFPATNGPQTSEQALFMLVPHYTVDTSIFICPGGRGDAALPAGESFRNRKISYAYYMGERMNDPSAPLMSDRQINTLSKMAGDFAFSTNGLPPGNNHHKYGGNVLFASGDMAMTPPKLAFPLAVTNGVVLLNPRR